MVLGAGALWLLTHELREYDVRDVGSSLSAIPRTRVALALALTGLNYLVLTGYDALALRYVRQPMSYRRTALASFIGYAFSIALGHAVLTGGAVRYRLYSRWGMPRGKIAAVVAFCGLAFWVGYLSLGGAVFALAPPPTPAGFPIPTRVLGVVFVGVFAAWLGVNAVREQPVHVWRTEIDPPGWRMTLAQAATASLDLTLAAGVLWLLLPAGAVGFGHLFGVYLLAVIAGVVSMVPGGLGVFDGLLLALLSPVLPTTTVLGTVVAYRAVYYLLPFLLALLALGATEVSARLHPPRAAPKPT